jgi:hypothetical protein
MLSMTPNLSSHIADMMRAEARRLTLRWRRRADRRARRVAPA